jgi:AraC-like DNA-binding protein
MGIFRTFFCLLIFFQFSFSGQPHQKAIANDSGCMVFEAPRYGSIIKSITCTLSIAACPEVESIHLSACFFPGNGMADTVLDLGTISQPPFKLMWNIADVPNQLIRGMWFLADAAFKNGSHRILRQDRVFLYTRPIADVEVVLPASADQQKLFFVDTLPSIGAPMILNVLGNWNIKELHFTVLVMDPSFSLAVPKQKLSELGVMVGLEPSMTKSAHPTETAIVLSFPLFDKPSRYIYKKINDPSGSFHYNIDTTDFPSPATVRTAEGKGYGLDIIIPQGTFEGDMPDSLLYNILIKVLDRNGQISALSTNRAASREALCPLVWSTMLRHQDGFFKNPLYIFFVCFGSGLAVVLLAGFLFYSKEGRTVVFNKLDFSEEEKQLAKTVYGYLEQNVTNKDVTLSEMAREVSVSGPKIESLVKKYNGLPFKKYLMRARVEIAKERLRSSHASESSVADTCGFKNILEMEKNFMKFCRTTPFRYRRENQVA